MKLLSEGCCRTSLGEILGLCGGILLILRYLRRVEVIFLHMGTLEEGERGWLPVPIPKCKEP